MIKVFNKWYSMNNKLKKCCMLILLSLLVAFSTLSVLADLDIEYSYKSESITISGSATKPFAVLTAYVVTPDDEIDMLSDDMLNDNKYVIKAFKADKNKSFTSTVKLPSWYMNGEYKLIITDGYDTKNITFTHLNVDKTLEALQGNGSKRGLNSATSPADLKNLLDSGLAEELGIKNVTDDISNGLYAGLTRSGYSVDSFNEELSRINVFVELKNTEDDEQAESIIKTYANFFEIDYATDFSTLNSEIKHEIISELKNAAIGEKPTLEMFLEQYMCALISSSQKTATVKDIIEKMGKDIQLDFQYYDKLPDYKKNVVISKLMDNQPTSLSDLVSYFYSASKAEYNSIDNGAGSSTKSGGGSSSGSSFSVKGNLEEAINNAQIIEKPMFSDLSGHWAKEFIEELADDGIISGFADGCFKPDNNVTRAEFSKMIYGMIKVSEEADDKFSDVSESDWFYKYVNLAYSSKIVNGYNNYFYPNENITREDCAVIIYRLFENNGITINGDCTFGDAKDISDYAIKAVGALQAEEIISGYNNNYMPKDNITRAEAAKIIVKVIEKIQEGTTSEN